MKKNAKFFEIKTNKEFNDFAMKTFNFQYRSNWIYKKYCDFVKRIVAKRVLRQSAGRIGVPCFAPRVCIGGHGLVGQPVSGLELCTSEGHVLWTV